MANQNMTVSSWVRGSEQTDHVSSLDEQHLSCDLATNKALGFTQILILEILEGVSEVTYSDESIRLFTTYKMLDKGKKRFEIADSLSMQGQRIRKKVQSMALNLKV